MISQFAEVIGSIALLVGGVATLVRGWVPAWFRSSVRRPVLFGWAQLILAVALIAYLGGDLLTNTPHLGLAVKASAVVVELFGFWLVDLADRKPRHR
jgi:hypothetical protein